jgi:hypothetical protein
VPSDSFHEKNVVFFAEFLIRKEHKHKYQKYLDQDRDQEMLFYGPKSPWSFARTIHLLRPSSFLGSALPPKAEKAEKAYCTGN